MSRTEYHLIIITTSRYHVRNHKLNIFKLFEISIRYSYNRVTSDVRISDIY